MDIKKITGIVTGLLGIVFGLITLRSGGTVLFVDGADREAAGNYVPFVLWFNFLAAFVYLVAGGLLIAGHRRASLLGFLIAGSSLFVLGSLGLHIILGGAFEWRTVYAMIFRTAFWVVISYTVVAVNRRPPGHGMPS